MVLSGPVGVRRATVLTKNRNEHLFILWQYEDWSFEGIIIPTGFASGYSGEGARGFSLALCMLHEQDIPIDHLQVYPREFNRVDAGYFPHEWQQLVRSRARKCEMPIRDWVFPQHWNLMKKGRLWRVQGWRRITIDFPDAYWDAAENVDNFSLAVGDKLRHALVILKPNSPPEKYQQAGIMLRDAWIELAREMRTASVPEHIGKDDVRAILDCMSLEEGALAKAKHAFSATNALQHDRNATWEAAKTCVENTVMAMSNIVGKGNGYLWGYRNDDEWIRPN